MQKLNVGLISKWHVHAGGYGKELAASGKVCIQAVWDEDADRGRQWAESLGAEFMPDYGAFLSRGDIAAVICNAPTAMHADLLVKAAEAGKHIFTEKLLTTNAADGERLKNAIDKSGVTFTVSLPLTSNPGMLYAKQTVDSGVLGRISGARMRRSHSGVSDDWLPEYWYDVSKTGGGSMMDLGAHPVYVLAFLFGGPVRVSGVMTNLYGTTSDENAIATVEFANGIIGTCETAFTTYGVPDILEVYGSDGSLFIWGDEVRITTKGLNKLGVGCVSPDKLPAALPSPILRFVDACIDGTGTPEYLGTDAALTMTKIIEAAYISDKENKIKVF